MVARSIVRTRVAILLVCGGALLCARAPARAEDYTPVEDVDVSWETPPEPEDETAWSTWEDGNPAVLDADGVEIVEVVPAPGLRMLPDGSRAVPVPFGDAEVTARRLGLGTHGAAGMLLVHEPRASWISAAGGSASPATLLWPVVGGHLGRGVGQVATHFHAGLDIGAPIGAPIRAAASGLVVYADSELRGYGNVVFLVHPGGLVTVYAHCERLLVFAGQHVGRGQVIARVGNTGLSRGPHLHFETRVGGQPQDPISVMVAR